MELMTNKMTMSSKEIAELTGKRHDNVLADIRKMLAEIGSPEKLGDYKDGLGRSYPMLLLDKNEALCLVAGYNSQMRMAIIKRWQELENANKPQIPTNFADALQLAADQAKQLEQQAPKVNYFDKVVERENLLNATQVAQKLKMSAVKMNRYLDEMKVYNNTIKRGRAFQQWFVDKGYGVMRQTELGYAQPMFTLQGEAWIIECLTAEGVA